MTFRSSRRLAFAVAALAVGPSCVDGDYNKFRVFQEPLVESVDALVPGETQLQPVLDTLGAPVFVIEVGLGMALAWGWQETTDWNIEVSGPVGDAQGNLKFTSTSEDTMGLVLFFDEAWRLKSVRKGFLADLVPNRQRPRDVEDDLAENAAP